MYFKKIKTSKAPEAIGPYSQGITIGNMIFTSGQLPIIPETGSVPEGIREQTRQCIMNIKEILESEGAGLDKVIKTSIYMTDLTEFSDMNEIYAQYFGNTLPARVTVGISSLAKGAKIEIEAIAIQK